MKLDSSSPKGLLAAAAQKYGLVLLLAVALPVGAYLAKEAQPDPVVPEMRAASLDDIAVRSYDGPGVPAAVPVVAPATAPAFVKGIYATASTVSSKTLFGRLVDLVGRTELNAMVIDVKDGDGHLAFLPHAEDLKALAVKRPPLGELSEFTAPLKQKGIYLIARVPVFEDSAYVAVHPEDAVGNVNGGVWRNRKGSVWVDPAATQNWRYNVAVAREAHAGGFDEVQFDYIRFPSDGNLKTIKYPYFPAGKAKWQQMAEFFAYLDRELRVKSHLRISVDLFGLTMVEHETDLNIGQRLRDALPRFDFISPMVYPSHYAVGFKGFANPADHPFEVVDDSMKKGNKLVEELKVADQARIAADPSVQPTALATFRPWLQDFNMGAKYDAAMVRLQMKAAQDNGASGWLLWNAGNVYTEAALEAKKP